MEAEEFYLEMKIRHPTLFSQIEKDSLGFSIGSGWFQLVKELLDALAVLRENGEFQVVHVKEKFGTLRVYVAVGVEDSRLRSEVNHVLATFETRSAAICERCGSKQGVLLHEPWDRVRCPKCQLLASLEN